MKKLSHILIIIILSMSLPTISGCSKKNPSQDYLNNISVSSDSDKIMQLNEHIFSSTTAPPDLGDYLIGPGDLLEIEVFESEKLNSIVRVSSRGFISLPLLGEILIEGLTASEAETMVEDEYKKSYIKNPHVSIFIKENFSQRVTVIGQVKKPGTYDYPSKQRLLDALALAGGLSENASQTIQVRRLSSAANGANQVLLINLDKLISEGKSELNININGGDIIFVPEAGIFYVGGAVHAPGKYHIKKTMTIKEALSAAGGLQPWADLEEILVLRYVKNSDREKITINLEEMPDQSNDQSKTFIIQDRDIITVDASFWGNLVYGSGFLIGVPGLGFNYSNPERR